MAATCVRSVVVSLALLILAALAGTAAAEQETAPGAEAFRAQAAALVQQFAAELQGRLKAALEEGGPARAISVCAEAAPALAARLSRESGASVRRVSLKARNPQDIPDAWEQSILRRFEQAVAKGQDPATLAHGDIVEEPAARYYRFMRAIPTQQLCLVCHGRSIDPETARALDERYPHDTARGYDVGTVRGAFTVKIPLP